MTLSERVARLRAQSIEDRPSLSAERAELLTDICAGGSGPVSIPVAPDEAI